MTRLAREAQCKWRSELEEEKYGSSYDYFLGHKEHPSHLAIRSRREQEVAICDEPNDAMAPTGTKSL
jgi:hypothetical protein